MMSQRKAAVLLMLLGSMTRAPLWADEPSSLAAALSLQGAFERAIEQTEPSVVSILLGPPEPARLTQQLTPAPRAFQIGTEQYDPRSPEFIPWAAGSGVIVSDQGLILTNYHVVDSDRPSPENAGPDLGQQPTIYVVVSDRRYFRAEIFAADPRSDLAVLRLVPETNKSLANFKPIRLGDAATLKKGSLVLALGNPYAIARDGSPSASWGIISNIGRKAEPIADPYGRPNRPTLHHFGTLLQTDARLNLGTSGGALMNLRGEMVGLTTSLAALAGYEQSAGYAIPINAEMRITIETLMQGQEREYGFLGINLGSSRPGDSGSPPGIIVSDVFQGTPASWGGLMGGDVILEINGHPITRRDDLMFAVGTLQVGAEISILLERDGKRISIPITLAKYPVQERDKIIATVRPKPWRGIRVDYPTAWYEVMSTTPLPPNGSVLVIEVEQNSAAAASGIEPKDLITEIARRKVRTPKDFYEVIQSLDNQRVEVHVAEKGVKTIEPRSPAQ